MRRGSVLDVLGGRAHLLLVSMWWMACAAGGAPEEVGRSDEAIINGTRETALREVVAVARLGATGGLCSGTVIARHAVLTAKHCVVEDSGAPIPPSQFLVVVGHDITSASGVEYTVQVHEIRTTPGSDIDSDIRYGNDIAILLLREDIGVPPREVSRTGPTTGETVTIAGFGRIRSGTPTDGDSGVKYRGTARVSDLRTRLMETSGTSWTCQGDSGGPAFGAGGVVGITSFGVSGCTSSYSYYTRVTPHLALIDASLGFVPPCEPSAEICDGIDNDCDGVVDNGCTGLGEPCTTDGECAMGGCEDVAGARVCVRDCDPRTAIPRCPFDFYCEVTGCGTGRCVRGSPGPKAAGEECAADADCASSHCLVVNGVSRCGRACSPEGEPCGGLLVCEAPATDCGSCVPVELSTGPRSFGAPCDTGDQCVSGSCPDGFCTRACSTDAPCPGGFHCRGGTCVRGDLGGPGSECVTAEDCEPGRAPDCVDAGGELLCAGPCDADGCPTPGFECAPSDIGDRCLPPGLPLGEACGAHDECRTGICSTTCTRLCDASNPCPSGFECVPAGDVSGCFPPGRAGGDRTDRGGCSVTWARSPAGALAALLPVIALLFRRRRSAF